MRLELLAKTTKDGGPCWDNSCPSASRVHGGQGGYLIVGLRPDDEMLTALRETPDIQVADGEVAAWIPDRIIEEILSRR
jgi:hypothetical protein